VAEVIKRVGGKGRVGGSSEKKGGRLKFNGKTVGVAERLHRNAMGLKEQGKERKKSGELPEKLADSSN